MVPSHVIAHLKLREGVRHHSYLDSLGKLTGGVGHLMSETEADLWPEGSKLPAQMIDTWLEQDSQRAWLAAYNQAQGVDYPKLQEALFHVNFQLGPGWNLIHKKTWALLKAHEWLEAAAEAEDSLWYQQTPLRVRDFQYSLLRTVYG